MFEGVSKISGFVSSVELDDRWWSKENEVTERGSDQHVLSPYSFNIHLVCQEN